MTPSHSVPESVAGAVDDSLSTDIAIVGCGAAGLAAAVGALEKRPDLKVLVIERSRESDRGGNTRWSSSFFRMTEGRTPAAGFEEDFASFTDGAADPAYVRRLRELSGETLEWVADHGATFEMVPMFFLTSSKPRLGVRGGGASIVEHLGGRAQDLGARFLYETEAVGLDVREDKTGPVVHGLRCRTPDGLVDVHSSAVILASGGYEGNVELMTETFGENAEFMRPVARGGSYNRGEGIQMALDAGAGSAGEWSNFHGEPVDPRSNLPEAVVMTFPYGVLVNADGDRFVDEGAGTVDETYEDVCRSIFAQPGNISYLIADHRILDLPGFERATLTDRPPYKADTVADLARKLDIDGDRLDATIAEFNSALRPADKVFDASQPDGLQVTGIEPPKSNWARAIDDPPYAAIPISTAICFTYGGIAVDTDARVLRPDGSRIGRLWAAGEMTGLYHRKYPGATSVLRSLVFGRVAGSDAASVSGGVQ